MYEVWQRPSDDAVGCHRHENSENLSCGNKCNPYSRHLGGKLNVILKSMHFFRVVNSTCTTIIGEFLDVCISDLAYMK